MGDPIREVTNTDEPCGILTPFSFDDNDESGKVLGKGGTGQALRGVKYVIVTAFDAGTLSIGKSGDTARYTTVINLVGLPVGTVVRADDILDEFTADTEIIATLVGSPTTGKLDGELAFHEQFSNAK